MDTQTRHALKGDKFAQATKTSVTWLSGHRSGVMRWVISAAVVCSFGRRTFDFLEHARRQRPTQLLERHWTPTAHLSRSRALRPQQGVYATSAERSKAANQQFSAIAQQYGWLPEGNKARYFAGVTSQELGQTATAEAELKKAADSWDHNLSNLAKLALANVYRQTGRDAQAIDIYNAIIAKPSETVSAGVAQLDLADLYVATGKQDQARALWAKVKDSDKDGAAGSIAAQKLAGGGQ